MFGATGASELLRKFEKQHHDADAVSAADALIVCAP
jgi:hypothetical protein